MSIKIQGTDVIDDSKNIVNVVNVTATTNVVAGQYVTATYFKGDGSQLTNAGASIDKAYFLAGFTSGGSL
jgi:hypothetical protein